MYNVEGILQTFQVYGGVTSFLALFLASVIYGFCHGREEERKRFFFLFVLSFLFVFNDLSMNLVGKVVGTATYYRFLWAIPVLPVIAWAGTKAITEREKRWEQALVLVLVFCLFWGGKNSFVTEGTIRIPENVSNVPKEVIQVCRIINEDKTMERPVVIFDRDCQMWSRFCAPDLVWGISRDAYQYHNDPEGYENAKKYKWEKAMIHAVNFGMKDEQEMLTKALEKKKVDYIVTMSAYQMDAYLDQAGYSLVDMTAERSVYARKE